MNSMLKPCSKQIKFYTINLNRLIQENNFRWKTFGIGSTVHDWFYFVTSNYLAVKNIFNWNLNQFEHKLYSTALTLQGRGMVCIVKCGWYKMEKSLYTYLSQVKQIVLAFSESIVVPQIYFLPLNLKLCKKLKWSVGSPGHALFVVVRNFSNRTFHLQKSLNVFKM